MPTPTTLATLRLRVSQTTRRRDYTFTCRRGKISSDILRIYQISDFQARGTGLSNGPSFFAATNMAMTRACTKAMEVYK